MRDSFTEVEQRRPSLELAAVVLLLLAAAAVVFAPGVTQTLTGVRADPAVAAPDELPPLAREDVAPFFAERDQLARIVVGEDTTLREFLDRNRLNRPWTRDQITSQLGDTNPAAPIAAGTVFRLRLTPTATDVPGAAVTP
jgi:hypothetical protein